MKPLEDKLQEIKSNTVNEIRKSIFDVIAAIIIIAVIAASMNVFGLIDFKEINIADFIISWIPYFLSASLLTINYYKKGVFVGKKTDKFKSVSVSYSDIVSSLSGDQIEKLDNFCRQYNNKSRIVLQTDILKDEGISYEMFEDGNEEKNIPALKILSIRQLSSLSYTRAQIRAIRKAKRAKVKGISSNLLLSTMNVKDPTNIGMGERSLATFRNISSIIRYFIITILMAFFGLKDISEWGWAGLILVLFKVAYMFAGSYMSYFKGYDDATMNVCDHIVRKTDILKMYLKYKPVSEE